MTTKLETNQIQQAVTAHHEGKLEEAERLYREILKIDFFHPDIHNNLGIIMQSYGKLDKAEVSFKKSIELNPNNAEVYRNLGNILINLGKLEEAEISYKKAIELKPNYHEVHNSLGTTQYQLDELDKALISFRKAIEFKPDYADAYNNLGLVMKELGNLYEAKKTFEKSIELKPRSAEAHNNLGNTLKTLGRLEEAELSFRKTLEIKPSNAIALNNLGVALFENKQYKKAAEQFILSDLDISKFYLLKCFYLLNQQSNFYNEIDFLLHKGVNNALIGSLISSAKIRYGINKPNPFCNDPLNYVLKTDLIIKCNFKNIFIKGASNILNDDKVENRRQGLLTSGVQTAGDIFLNGGKTIDEMKKIIYSEIEKYRVNFKDSNEGFLKKWPTDYFIKGWLVSMKSGGKLAPHMHELGWLSGSIYINVPPKSKVDSGNLVVCMGDSEQASSEKQNKKSMDVVTGSLCLFPSSLHHYTIPFESNQERIVLAFDVMPK